MRRTAATASYPADLRLVFDASLADSYEMSSVLLARAGFDGTLHLLTSGWERALGYTRQELGEKPLSQLMGSDRKLVAAAIAAILGRPGMQPVELRLRCRNGRAKRLRLHRRYDGREQAVYIVAEEAVDTAAGAGG
jgi:PAS domain-containing protein